MAVPNSVGFEESVFPAAPKPLKEGVVPELAGAAGVWPKSPPGLVAAGVLEAPPKRVDPAVPLPPAPPKSPPALGVLAPVLVGFAVPKREVLLVPVVLAPPNKGLLLDVLLPGLKLNAMLCGCQALGWGAAVSCVKGAQLKELFTWAERCKRLQLVRARVCVCGRVTTRE